MKASQEDQALLLDLQAFDTRLAQLKHRARRLPETTSLAELRGREDALRSIVAERTGAWEDVSTELTRVESDVALVEARIARDADRLRSTSSAKDAQALEQELAALGRRQHDLEDIQLEVMERVEQAQTALDGVHTEASELRDRVVAVEQARDDALGGLERERIHTEANRATIAARVPEDLLALYEKQRARYGVGASLLQGGVTSASGVALNASDMNTIRHAESDDVLICPDSNAVLVRTAESGI